MAYGNKVQICSVFLIMVIISTSSIPIDRNEPLNAVQVPESRDDMMIRYRLPNNTVPRLYKICIEPNMENENLTWTGKISIDIEVLQATPVLILHAYKNLVMHENFTELVGMNGTTFKPITQSRDENLEFFKVQFDFVIPVGNYTFNLAFEGEDCHDGEGFFKSSSDRQNGPPIAGTQFEATSARRAFPCLDEPSLKARFQMSIRHFRNYTAISNMPEIANIAIEDGKTLTTFDTTPIMSTYLLAFVVADFGNISNEYGNVTLWARKEVLEEARLVLDFSPKVVEVMEKYTGLPFGFPRIGSVLLPRFTSAATEHWGLVTYRENLATFDRTSESFMEADRVYSMVAHELAHSWFGNRVSPVWWNDLWLNEAFAAYFQYLIMDESFDNWGGEELFVLRNNYGTSFRADNARAIPVRWTPASNSEIMKLATPITYSKGAAILHMFRKVLTDAVFQAGIQKYLDQYSFRPASGEDLMRALQETYNESIYARTPLNFRETMTSWLTQVGYPIVNVTRNYETGATTVAQESALSHANITNKWWIPLTYATQSNHNFSSTVPSRWITDKEDTVTIDGINKDDWVIFNIQSSGYYRVIYDEENWNRITNYLNTDNYKNISVLNRAQLLNDAIFMMKVDPDRYYEIFYKLTKYLSRETEYLPWFVAQSVVKNIELLDGTDVYKTIQQYALGLMDALIKEVGFEKRDTDDHLTILARKDLVSWACLAGHTGCTEYAAEKLVQVVENGTNHRLNPDDAASIYCAGFRGLNDTKAKEVVAWVFENTKNEIDIDYLGCTENHNIHREYLIGNKTEHSEDSWPAISTILGSISKGSDENFNFTVDFLLENHEALTEFESPEERLRSLGHAAIEIAQQVKTASRLEKFKKVLQLDGNIKFEEFDKRFFLNIAQSTLADCDELLAELRNIWNEQLSALI